VTFRHAGPADAVFVSSVSVDAMKPPEAIDPKNLGSPDTAWTFLDESERAAVQLGRVAIGRAVYRPGWRWSQHVQPLSGRDSVEHIGYVISGRMGIRAQAGTEVEVGPGDAFIAAPGHDAWVVGDEPCVALDFIPA
jgi:quercetin dioxygenase-like cupin family protein